MSNFTPAPWRIEYHGDFRDRDIISNSTERHGVMVAYVSALGSKTWREESEANAQLIAAAPEIYEALCRAIPWLGKLIADGAHLNSVAPNDAIGALAQAEAAIAKARDKGQNGAR